MKAMKVTDERIKVSVDNILSWGNYQLLFLCLLSQFPFTLSPK